MCQDKLSAYRQNAGVMTKPSAQDVKMRLAARLRLVREGMDLSQQDFAARLGISQTRYSKYESGRSAAPYDILIGISEISGQTLDFLIAGRATHLVTEAVDLPATLRTAARN
jgi:transcriptional regulator with XRE-family HTH domain